MNEASNGEEMSANVMNDAMEGQVRVAVVPEETKWEMWQMVEVSVGVHVVVVGPIL
jgi:hypothetical protein